MGTEPKLGQSFPLFQELGLETQDTSWFMLIVRSENVLSGADCTFGIAKFSQHKNHGGNTLVWTEIAGY